MSTVRMLDSNLGAIRTGASLTAVLIVAVACHGERDEARRTEAGRVARAVEALRAAPGRGRGPFLSALHAAPCSSEDVCGLKKTCGDAYDVERAATDAIAAVRHAAENPSGGPVPAGAVELLTRAEQDLHRAAALMRACADREADARRRYSL